MRESFRCVCNFSFTEKWNYSSMWRRKGVEKIGLSFFAPSGFLLAVQAYMVFFGNKLVQ